MGMILVALVVALSIPVEALAQSRRRETSVVVAPQGELPRWSITQRTGSPSDGYPRDPLPRFTIPPRHGASLPLPSIGLLLPPIGLQPRIDGHRFDGHRLGRRHHRARFATPWSYPLIAVPPYVEVVTPVPVPVPTLVEQPKPMGSLILDVRPGYTQLFVDGYYVGTPDDLALNGGALSLEPGPHRIDLTAPGHESVTVDVRVAANQPISYSRILESIDAKPMHEPPARPAPNGSTTFYLVPGCYMGNVPPEEARLPSSCDVSRTIKFQQ